MRYDDNILLEYLVEHYIKGRLSFNQISRKFLEEYKDEERGFYAMKQKFYRMYKSRYSDGGEEIEIEVKEAPPKYSVVSDDYVIATKKGKDDLVLPINVVDDIFFHYVAKGKGWDGQKTARHFKLTPWQWNALKTAFDLYKTSNIYSPYTWENTPVEKREELISEKISKLHDNESELIDKVYYRQMKRELQKLQKEKATWKLNSDYLIDNIIDHVKRSRTVVIKKTVNIVHKVDWVFAAIGDAHLGFERKQKGRTQGYNIDVCHGRIRETSDVINDFDAKNVHIGFLGDVMESGPGTNHSNVWQELSMWGDEAVMASYELFLMIIDITRNLISLDIVEGNHDRLTEKNQDDMGRALARLIIKMLDINIKGKIEIGRTSEFYGGEGMVDVDVLRRTIDDVNFILLHGDKKAFGRKKMSGLDIAWKSGDNFMQNVVLGAHLHQFIQWPSNQNYKAYTIPSIVTENNYASSLGYETRPGFMLFMKHKGRLIDHIIEYKN